MNADAPPRPWFREPMLWLVIGLPASVVVAGVATLAIAVAHPDELSPPTLDTTLACTPTGNSKLPPDCR